MNPMILASSSPRRRDLLKSMGLSFQIFSPDVDEHVDLPPENAVKELSLRKATAAFQYFPDRIIIAADTLVAIGEKALGKPLDREDARNMLLSLSGHTHSVWTGMTVIHPSGKLVTVADVSNVTFRLISEEEILQYIDSGEPFDKAGSYAIQGLGGKFVDRLSGEMDTVIGLNRKRLRCILHSFRSGNG